MRLSIVPCRGYTADLKCVYFTSIVASTDRKQIWPNQQFGGTFPPPQFVIMKRYTMLPFLTRSCDPRLDANSSRFLEVSTHPLQAGEELVHVYPIGGSARS